MYLAFDPGISLVGIDLSDTLEKIWKDVSLVLFTAALFVTVKD